MRKAFINTLIEICGKDKRVVLLTGDLGYMSLEPFRDKFKDRFFNVGVAEQNMVGVATGLADAGFIPFVYSINTFASLRPYEFIRNGPIMHRLPVRIIAIGGGFEYGHDGLTHFGLEDIGVMRVQPGIAVIAPADYEQASASLLATWDYPGPVYYRLGKDDKTKISGLNGKFELARAQFIGDGKDALVITMGSVAAEASRAVDILAQKGVCCTHMIVASVTPAPIDDIAAALGDFRLAMTVEAHYVWGGVGSLVSEVAAERGLSCRVLRCGVKAVPDGISGSQPFLYAKNGLSAEILADTALKAINR